MTEQTAAAEVDYAAFWWAQQSGETETWEQLDAEEREAVMENCYAETVADWLATREAAARAEALREAADAVEEECAADSVTCYCSSARWLRDRAARIARTDGAGS